MTTEGLVRDEVVVEEYRATTALMQVADALKNLVGYARRQEILQLVG